VQAAPAAARYQVGSLMTSEGCGVDAKFQCNANAAEQSVQWSCVWSNSALHAPEELPKRSV
jgi:hypothetical protein